MREIGDDTLSSYENLPISLQQQNQLQLQFEFSFSFSFSFQIRATKHKQDLFESSAGCAEGGALAVRRRSEASRERNAGGVSIKNEEVSQS